MVTFPHTWTCTHNTLLHLHCTTYNHVPTYLYMYTSAHLNTCTLSHTMDTPRWPKLVFPAAVALVSTLLREDLFFI